MKRSKINAYINEALNIFSQYNIHLPCWCNWTMTEWQENLPNCEEILAVHLGWDITDFGSGNYEKRGLLLITLRNGAPPVFPKPYAEKIMIVKENQETPFHYHWKKQEDIINRAGGILVIELLKAGEDDEPLPENISIQIDGVKTTVVGGEPILLNPGQSITMPRRIYHRFYALKGNGYVLAGEVSSTNDDDSDNRFYENLGRFPEVDEDETPIRLMISDYNKFLV